MELWSQHQVYVCVFLYMPMYFTMLNAVHIGLFCTMMRSNCVDIFGYANDIISYRPDIIFIQFVNVQQLYCLLPIYIYVTLWVYTDTDR